jgi:RimJ/RimL family protein N-acetyltransferase
MLVQQAQCMLGQPVDPTPALVPQRTTLSGRLVVLEPLEAVKHAAGLWMLTRESDGLWQYLPYGPFDTYEAFQHDLEEKANSDDPLFFAILDRQTSTACGYAALMRIIQVHRCIEVGHVLYSPRLQRSPGATEAMYLLARYVFEDLHYRRYEWKCDALNAGSRRAALRLGFQFEGIFRQHMIVKSRNRDTAWFSMLDSEWPVRKANFERWLSPANFDCSGRQLCSLTMLNQSEEAGNRDQRTSGR